MIFRYIDKIYTTDLSFVSRPFEYIDTHFLLPVLGTFELFESDVGFVEWPKVSFERPNERLGHRQQTGETPELGPVERLEPIEFALNVDASGVE